VVEGLSAYLEQNGIRCFIAYRDIAKGIDWAEAITVAIERCRLMVIVFSDHFNRSKQVDREISLAIEEQKPILTFKIQNAAFTGTKKYYLQNLNWIDAFPNTEKYFGNLCENALAFMPDLRLKKKNQNKSDKEQPMQETVEQITDRMQEKEQTNKYPAKILYSVLGGIIAIALISWLIVQNNKTGNEPNITPSQTTNTEIIEQPQPLPDNSAATIVPKDTIIPQVPTETKPPTETNKATSPIPTTITVTLQFDHEDVLISESGERFSVKTGDTFTGEMKGNKAVYGKIRDKEGNVQHLIYNKKNQ